MAGINFLVFVGTADQGIEKQTGISHYSTEKSRQGFKNDYGQRRPWNILRNRRS